MAAFDAAFLDEKGLDIRPLPIGGTRRMKDQLSRSMGNEQAQWSRYNGEKVDGVSTPSSFFAGKAKKLPALCAGLALLAGVEAADAASLWWDKTRVHTASVRECLAIAHEAMQGLNYQNIRLSRDEVAGSAPGVYAAVTCVGTNPATAVVMVAGDQVDATRTASETLSKKIGGTIHP